MEAGVGADCASVQVSSVDDALHAGSLGTPRSHFLQPDIFIRFFRMVRCMWNGAICSATV